MLHTASDYAHRVVEGTLLADDDVGRKIADTSDEVGRAPVKSGPDGGGGVDAASILGTVLKRASRARGNYVSVP